MQQLALAVAFLQEQDLPRLPVQHHRRIAVPLVQRELVDAQVCARMGGEHRPVPVPQPLLVQLPDQLAVRAQGTRQALDRHVAAAEEPPDLGLQAGGDAMPLHLEGDGLPRGPAAPCAQQLLIADIHHNLAVPQRQVVQLYMQLLVGMQPPTTVGAAVGDRASDPSVQRLDDDPVTAYLLFRIGDRSCRLKFWQL